MYRPPGARGAPSTIKLHEEEKPATSAAAEDDKAAAKNKKKKDAKAKAAAVETVRGEGYCKIEWVSQDVGRKKR